MKLIRAAVIAFSITLFATGCNQSEGLMTATTEDVQQLIDDQKNGFVVITNETDALFLDEAEKALLEKRSMPCNSMSSAMTEKMRTQMV